MAAHMHSRSPQFKFTFYVEPGLVSVFSASSVVRELKLGGGQTPVF
jgi:hypothetical protein